jgi:hypothetical protein
MRTCFIVAAILLSASIATAKHDAPPVVEPVVYRGVRIVVPNDNGARGYVEAYDEATGAKLWDLTIYRVWISPFSFAETDTQWIFIRSVRLVGNTLAITDERDRVFRVDLETRSVERLEVTPHALSNKQLQPARAAGPKELHNALAGDSPTWYGRNLRARSRWRIR